MPYGNLAMKSNLLQTSSHKYIFGVQIDSHVRTIVPYLKFLISERLNFQELAYMFLIASANLISRDLQERLMESFLEFKHQDKG